MSGFDNTRLEIAKAIPIMEVANRLPIIGLKRNGLEHTGPCPVCGGDDRFSINPQKNIFLCRTCDVAGDQIKLVEHTHGVDFKTALAYLAGDAEAQVDPEKLAERQRAARKIEADRKRVSENYRARAISRARNIWARAVPAAGTLVDDYLKLRGLGRLEFLPPTLRFIADHPFCVGGNSGAREIHRGPCMIAGIQAANGKVRGVHQTWIDLDRPSGKVALEVDGKKQPAKKVLGSKKGGTIRLSRLKPGGALVMGEGIETTLTALQAGVVEGATYWAGVDLGNMAGRQMPPRNSGLPDMDDQEAFVPPADFAHLIYIQDGDSAAAPTRAKLLAGCRRAMKLRAGLTASIAHAGAGVDLNDLINQQT